MIAYGEQIDYPHTGRGLDDLGRRLGPGVIEEFIERRSAAGRPCRVLEIGCGVGRVLMELRSRFPSAELHGINHSPWPAMRGSQSLPAMAAFYGIEPPARPDIPLPAIHFCGAERLPLPSEHFDLIFSQATLHFVERKDRAVEEMLRVLRPEGEAHVHVDSTSIDSDDACPRFVIESNGAREPTLEHLAARCFGLASVEWELKAGVIGGRVTILRATKMRPGGIDLRLSFDDGRSGELHEEDAPSWGFRSVFNDASGCPPTLMPGPEAVS